MPMKYTSPKKEKPKLAAHRLYGIDRKYLRMLKRNANAKREKTTKLVSESDIVRTAIRSLHAHTFHATK